MHLVIPGIFLFDRDKCSCTHMQCKPAGSDMAFSEFSQHRIGKVQSGCGCSHRSLINPVHCLVTFPVQRSGSPGTPNVGRQRNLTVALEQARDINPALELDEVASLPGAILHPRFDIALQ